MRRQPHPEVVRLRGPLTLSFMTYAKELGQQTDWARRAGHELFLHVPMISKLTSVPSLIAAGPAASSCAMPSATCWDREFADSPLEGSGFEPLVPSDALQKR
jgi:hypothetical protein